MNKHRQNRERRSLAVVREPRLLCPICKKKIRGNYFDHNLGEHHLKAVKELKDEQVPQKSKT